jgi:hypothetical protein
MAIYAENQVIHIANGNGISLPTAANNTVKERHNSVASYLLS